MDVDTETSQTALACKTHAFSGKSLRDYPLLIEQLLIVKRAASYANFQISAITKSDFEHIDAACQHAETTHSIFSADVFQGGGGIAVHMNLNEALCALLGGDDWLPKVNASQSTTDVCSTALNLSLVYTLRDTEPNLASLVTVLTRLGKTYEAQPTRGRTCLRDAGYLSYGARFSGFAQLFERHRHQLHSLSEFAYCNLGATALGTGEGIKPELRKDYSKHALDKLRQLTSIPIKCHPNFIDSVQNRDDLFALANALESLATSFIKMAKDIRLLASGPAHGFNEVTVPALIKGSSFYPNKINPTLEETVIQMGFLMLGLLKSAKLGIEHSELDMNIYYMHSAICLLDAINLANALLPKYVQFNLSQLHLTGTLSYESSD